MIVYPEEEHVKHQPKHRLRVYQRNIDWFRFWLQDHQDADPSKAEQYARWRELRKLQGTVELHRWSHSRAYLVAGQADRVEAWTSAADVTWLQSMGPGGIQYSRYLAVAESAAIAMHAREYGEPLPPGPITHEGLEIGFAEKASTIRYWHDGRWYRL
jgi:hypothetical protein